MVINLSYLNESVVDRFISNALQEDLGEGDHTSLASIPDRAMGQAQLLIKGVGIIAGVELALKIFYKVDPQLSVEALTTDGSQVTYGKVAMVVKGDIKSILASERLVLNCMQRMSGIATYTRQFVDAISGTNAQVLDTRKTTPNFRILEKWAVAIGGGINHRVGLYDMILLKDNHVDFAGGIKAAIMKTVDYQKRNGLQLKVEIETRTIQEVQEALDTGHINRIMLDNMSIQEMQTAVKMIDKQYETEASGGITLDNVRSIALTGVDYVSVGSLTHSVKSLDLSLKAIK